LVGACNLIMLFIDYMNLVSQTQSHLLVTTLVISWSITEVQITWCNSVNYSLAAIIDFATLLYVAINPIVNFVMILVSS
jgi:hypothetical protein